MKNTCYRWLTVALVSVFVIILTSCGTMDRMTKKMDKSDKSAMITPAAAPEIMIEPAPAPDITTM